MATDPLEERAKLYCRLMNAIRDRLAWLESVSVFDRPGPADMEEMYQAEGALLCLRKTLELIAYSSLIVNEELVREIGKKIETLWRAEDILKLVEKANPGFYPVSVCVTVTDGQPVLLGEKKTADVLGRAEFTELYDMCSKIIHVSNPLKLGNIGHIAKVPKIWVGRIRALLETHTIRLVSGETGIVMMNSVSQQGAVFYAPRAAAGPLDTT